MNIEYYEKTMQKMAEASMVNKGIADYENGKVVDGGCIVQKAVLYVIIG